MFLLYSYYLTPLNYLPARLFPSCTQTYQNKSVTTCLQICVQPFSAL